MQSLPSAMTSGHGGHLSVSLISGRVGGCGAG